MVMSICFTWFPIGGLGEPNIYHDSGGFYKNVGILLGGLSDCEELEGDNYTGDDGVVFGGDFTWRVVNMNLLLKNRQTNRQH